MSDRVRFGVLGCASIAVNKVIPGMQRSERCEVVAIGSRDADRAAAAAASLGIATSHGSYDDVLADDAVEAVYIPLPNHLHSNGRGERRRPAATCCARSRSVSTSPRLSAWSMRAGTRVC